VDWSSPPYPYGLGKQRPRDAVYSAGSPWITAGRGWLPAGMSAWSMTSTIMNINVRFTTAKLALIEIERSLTMVSLTEGGMPACSLGSIDLIRSTSCKGVRTRLTLDPDHLADMVVDPVQLRGTSDPSTTRPMSAIRAGAPLR
jgi:hypothetical protein